LAGLGLMVLTNEICPARFHGNSRLDLQPLIRGTWTFMFDYRFGPSARLIYALLAGILGFLATPNYGAENGALKPEGKAEHVVLIVWDGMRPDFITPEHAPNLWRLVTNGVFFKGHHSMYISSTEVNGTALATGAYPGHSGIIANDMYLPQMNWLEPVATESVDTIRRSDGLTFGHYLPLPTLEELVQQAGFPTVIAGSKGVVLLHDRFRNRVPGAARESAVVCGGRTIPSSLLPAVCKNNGKDFPSSATPNKARDEWTTKALTDTLWKDGVPRFSLLWLSEPDATQHIYSPGSPSALAAIASSDRDLGTVLTSLDKKGVREKTDVFVVSDHAFSTVEKNVDVASLVKKAGFSAARKLEDPEPGQVLVVGLGGSVLFYVIEHEEATVRKLVRFLQESDFAGVIFARVGIAGTFLLEQGLVDSGRNQPDVVLSLRWSNHTNEFGAAGSLVADSVKKGAGTHGSLSPFDLHNTLVAAGPDLRCGFVDELPSGNIDVAPTILSLLGIQVAHPMDGRVLTEALVAENDSNANPELKTLEATADLNQKQWHQYLKMYVLDGRTYFDEGNGGSIEARKR